MTVVAEQQAPMRFSCGADADDSRLGDLSTLTFKKMFGQDWEEAVGSVVHVRREDGVAVELGTVRRVAFTNFGGPFRVRVELDDGDLQEFPFGPFAAASPVFAVSSPPSE